MFVSFPPGRARQLVRLLVSRILIIFGLLFFIYYTSFSKANNPFNYAGLSLSVFVALLFFLTLIYLWWLRSNKNLELLTRIQCALDPFLVVILVILTGSFNSPFLFLNGLVTLNAALLLGRREALLTAGMIMILSASALSLTTLLLKMPIEPAPVLLRGFLLHGIAYFLTALLGGALAQRAASLQQAFDRQTDSLADLSLLHEQIVASIPYGLISVNNQGVIRTINPGVLELLGQNSIILLDKPLNALFPEFQWVIDQTGGNSTYIELPLKERIWGLNVSFLYNHRQERIGALLIIRDLTPIKQLEQKLADREKLALTGRMAAGMAHEIRNPLASILSAAQMLSPQNPHEQHLLTIIQEEVIRLKQLTGDFLLFSRPSKPKRQLIDTVSFLMEIAEQIKQDPRWENRELSMSTIRYEIKIWFDSSHLRQIFWNLFLNAMQATSKDGKITIHTELINNQIKITFHDNGPGVDAEMLPKLIEPFFTTRAYGSGLGLSVVHHLILLNDAILQFKQSPHGGLQVELICEGVYGKHSGL